MAYPWNVFYNGSKPIPIIQINRLILYIVYILDEHDNCARSRLIRLIIFNQAQRGGGVEQIF